VEWQLTKTSANEELAKLTTFTMTKVQPGETVKFRITVKEYAVPPAGQRLRFFAEADKRVNQNSAPLLPSGWGSSETEALEGCLRLIRSFPYEGKDRD
jgi:hypothetical protein